MSGKHLIDAISVLNIKRLEHLTIGAHIYLAIGESAIDIHYKQLNIHSIILHTHS